MRRVQGEWLCVRMASDVKKTVLWKPTLWLNLPGVKSQLHHSQLAWWRVSWLTSLCPEQGQHCQLSTERAQWAHTVNTHQLRSSVVWTAISPLGARIKVQVKTHLVFQPRALELRGISCKVLWYAGKTSVCVQTLGTKGLSKDNKQKNLSEQLASKIILPILNIWMF